MGQQSNGVGLRYGVIDGWNSSWSINSKDDIEYRDLVQISSDVEKLVTNLFRLNQGLEGAPGGFSEDHPMWVNLKQIYAEVCTVAGFFTTPSPGSFSHF